MDQCELYPASCQLAGPSKLLHLTAIGQDLVPLQVPLPALRSHNKARNRTSSSRKSKTENLYFAANLQTTQHQKETINDF